MRGWRSWSRLRKSATLPGPSAQGGTIWLTCYLCRPVMLFMKGTPSAPQCGFSRQLVSILRENQVKYGYVIFYTELHLRSAGC